MLACPIDGYWSKCLPNGDIQWLLVKPWTSPPSAMRAVLYCRITMAIKTASFVGVCVDCCLFACCPGGRWGDMEQVVARCRHPVASGVALVMLHQAMCFVLHRRKAMAIKMAGVRGVLFPIVNFVINHNRS